jgi:quinol monooxygenase YgiN
MTKQEVHFIVSLAVNEGKLEEFKSIAQSMIAATQTEPGASAYEWFFSSDGTRCRLLERYARPEAVLAHLAGAGVQEFLPRLLKVSIVAGFEVYGDPGPKGTETLTAFGAEIFQLWQGLDR